MPNDVTVVIACYTERRWTSLLEAIASVRAQTYPHRLVVVVDHNDLLHARLLRHCPDDIAVVRNAGPRGASGARNTAALAATTTFVAFLDDDARAEPTWLERLVAAVDRPDAVGAGGHIAPAWRARRPRWFPREFGWVVGVSLFPAGTTARRVRNVWSASMIVDREVFVGVRGFRADFGKVGDASEPEDTELCLRMAATAPDAHWLLVPDAVIHHEVPAERTTWAYFLRRCWQEGTGKAALARLSSGRTDGLSAERTYLRRVVPRGLVRYLGQMLRGDIGGVGRCAAVVAGLLVTALGFALATTRGAATRGAITAANASEHGRPAARRRRVRRRSSALPILMYHSIPSRVPMPTDPLRVPLPELRRHLYALRADGWDLLGLTEALAVMERDPARRVVALTFDDGYADFLGAADLLEQIGARATLYVSTAIIGTDGGRYGRMLTWQELDTLAARGVEIGSHARHHRPIDVLPAAVIRDEVTKSRRELERRVGRVVTSFCFPNGYTSRRVRRALTTAGYTNACIVGRRIATIRDDRYTLPRLHVGPGTGADDLRHLLSEGEPGPVPLAKRVLQPAWRLVRLMSLRLLQRELT